MTDNSSPPPGWYPDPTSAERLRHWDGGAWTDEVKTRRPPVRARPNRLDPGSSDTDSAHSTEPAILPHSNRVQDGGAPTALLREPTPGGQVAAQPQRLSGPHKHRRRDGTNALLGTMLAAFAAVGMFEVASGGSTRNTQSTPVGASAAAAPNATTTTLPVAPVGCANPKYLKELSATTVIVSLRAMHLPLVVAAPELPSTTEVPGGVAPAGGASAQMAAVATNPPGACTTASFVDQRGRGVSYVTVYPTSSAAA
ncbi:MAG TPA: DUF2510 domain-containing protein, partial [Polyangiaceae bacterium]|nr:DUF2510 domain-containing protein [Polyangiaceae bacterium]